MEQFRAVVSRFEDDKNYTDIFECHVIASDEGDAREKVKAHLRSIGRDHDALQNISMTAYRLGMTTNLPLIK